MRTLFIVAFLFSTIIAIVVLDMLGASSNRLNLQQQSNGIVVTVDGKQIGFATAFNFASSTGLVQVCSAADSQVSCTPSYNTALLVTKTNLQAGTATHCVSSNGTFGYTCGLNPVGMATTIVPGMELEFVPDVPCTAAQNCSLTVDNAGLFSIRANDGGNNGVAISGNGHITHRLAVDSISGSTVWRLIY